ncbi:MAG: rhamnulokinase family protein [Tepidisphaeraceae bacterium]
MPRQRFLAFDLGAESGRAVLGTLDSGRLELAEMHRFANPNGKMSGRLQWNLLAQWEELKTGLRKAASGPGILDGIGVDTWGVDFGLVSPSGEVLTNPVMYRDGRTDGLMAKAFAKVSKDRIFQATGIQFMQINTLYQLLAMRMAKSSLLDSAQTLLFMPDLFHYLFSGVRKSEVSIASTAQMYNPRTKTWANDILKELDLPVHLLPPIVQAGTVLGDLLPEVAQDCGAGRVRIIAPASHDTASAVAAVPAEGEDWCYISSGTWSLMGVELDEPVITNMSLAYNYTNEIGAAGKIRFLKNIMGMWLVQECRRQWQTQGYDHGYAELTSMASRSVGLGTLIDPDHEPFLAPGNMVGKIEKFCQQTKQRLPATRGDYVRTCLDSLALTYRRTLSGLEDLTGRKINVIHIVGGGSQNELLNQMTADACGRTVVAGPIEATAAGNIVVQAMAVGTLKSMAEVRTVIRESFHVKRYEPTDTQKWDRAYERYMEIVAKRQG